MKRILIGLALAAALQGCAVNVITAPHGSFQLSTGGGWAENSKAIQEACDAALESAVEDSGLTAAELATDDAQAQLKAIRWKCNHKLGNTL